LGQIRASQEEQTAQRPKERARTDAHDSVACLPRRRRRRRRSSHTAAAAAMVMTAAAGAQRAMPGRDSKRDHLQIKSTCRRIGAAHSCSEGVERLACCLCSWHGGVWWRHKRITRACRYPASRARRAGSA